MSETLNKTNETLSIINSVPENFSCEMQKLTPEWCKLFLSDDLIDSKRENEYVKKIVELINEKKYINNGSAIIFSNENEILSGEEIMIAVVITGKEINHIVSRNVSSNAFMTVNIFAQRKNPDIISIAQKKLGQDNDNSQIVSNMIKTILKFDENGIYYEKKKIDVLECENFYENNFIKINRIVEKFNIFPNVKITSSVLNSNYEGVMLPSKKNIYLALLYLFSSINEIEAYNFFKLLFTRISLTETENKAIYDARQKLIKAHESEGLYINNKDALKKRFSEMDILYLLINAWNSWTNKDNSIVIDFPKKALLFLRKKEENILKITNYHNVEINNIENKIVQEFESKNNVIYPEISIKVELITPQLAEEYLLKNNMNRKAKNTVVNKYINDMKKGNWMFNGTTIKISTTGQILDAQHRLKACVRSGKSFYSVVVKGINEDAFKTYDIEKPDNAKEVFKKYLEKIEKNPNINQTYILNLIEVLIDYNNQNIYYSKSATIQDKIAILEDNDNIINFCGNFKMNKNEYRPLKDKYALFFAYMILNSSADLSLDVLQLIIERSQEDSIVNYNIKETKEICDEYERKQSKKDKNLDIKILNRFIVAWNCIKQNRKIDIVNLKQELNSKEKQKKIIEIC